MYLSLVAGCFSSSVRLRTSAILGAAGGDLKSSSEGLEPTEAKVLAG